MPFRANILVVGAVEGAAARLTAMLERVGATVQQAPDCLTAMAIVKSDGVEAAVLAESPYPVSAHTLEDCQTLFFPKKDFLNLLTDSPRLARNMMATMSHLLYHLTRQLEDLSLKEVSSRLAQYLLQRCLESHGRVAPGLSFELPVTKTHLAAYLGTISETLSRTLARFKALGVLQVDKSRIIIEEPELLEKIAKGMKI